MDTDDDDGDGDAHACKSIARIKKNVPEWIYNHPAVVVDSVVRMCMAEKYKVCMVSVLWPEDGWLLRRG